MSNGNTIVPTTTPVEVTESPLRYIKVDYESHRDALLQRVRGRWPSNWNDFLSNSLGMVFVDLMSWSTATNAFLINRAAGENFIPTMTLRESAARLGELVGYRLRGQLSAVVSCEATLTTALTAPVTIFKGTTIRTSDTNLPFEVSEDYVIDAGQLTPRRLVAVFSPTLSGPNVINSYVQVTNGSANVDLVDTTINLADYVEAGQSFNVAGETTSSTITAIETVEGAVSANTRMVLAEAWTGETGVVAAEVYDRRIVLVQGQTITDRFLAPEEQSPSYIVKLSRTPVVDDSVEVTVNGITWSQVENLGLANDSDEVWQLKTFVSGTVAVLFGDGRFGAMIPPEATIVVTYRVGGGSDGNIATNTINTTLTGLINALSGPVPVTITNAISSGTGGRDAETLDEARVNIPAYIRTNDRAVTLSDYQTLAQAFSDPDYGNVAYARTTVRTENALLEGNIVVVYAWTTGPSGGLVSLSAPLKLALTSYLQTKAVGTDYVQIYDGTSRPVPVSIRFRTLGGYTAVETERLVEDTLQGIINTLRPGDPIYFSNLVRALDEVQGVDTLSIATPTDDLYPSNTTELFTAPQDDFVYDLTRNGVGIPVADADGAQVSQYTAQLPVFPLAVWSFRLFLGSSELTLTPHTTAGYARILGTDLSDDDAYPSLANLLTGTLTLWLKGAPGDLTMKLVTAQGYSSERQVNLYIGYTGDTSATKRQEIRSAIRAWGASLPIGGAMYATTVSGVSASRVSIADVVAAISGVTAVNRVALDSPASSEVRIQALDSELLRIGSISLNNYID
jgi:hypothetical protein